MLKELKDTVVNVKTQEEYDELMRIYEENGLKWSIQNYNVEFFGEDIYKYGNCNVISLQEFKEIQGIGKELTLKEFLKKELWK